MFHKYGLEAERGLLKTNVIPMAVSERKRFSLREPGDPERAGVARLGWE
jgi:hypothetical protein